MPGYAEEHHCHLLFQNVLDNCKTTVSFESIPTAAALNIEDLPRNDLELVHFFSHVKSCFHVGKIYQQRLNSCAGKRSPNGSDVRMTQTNND